MKSIEELKTQLDKEPFTGWEWKQTTIQLLGFPKVGGSSIGLSHKDGVVTKADVLVIMASDNLPLAALNAQLLLNVLSLFVPSWSKRELWLKDCLNEAAKAPKTSAQKVKREGYSIVFRANKQTSMVSLSLEA